MSRFGTYPMVISRLPISANRTNETMGQTVEQAIANNAGLETGLDVSRVDQVLLPLMQDILTPLQKEFQFIEAIGSQNGKVDFKIDSGPLGQSAGTVSVKSTFRGDKVCPQVIGQTTKERYMTHFNIAKNGNAELEIKRHFLSNPAMVCYQMLQHLNCCDYIVYVSASLSKRPVVDRYLEHINICAERGLEIDPTHTLGNIAVKWFHRSMLENFQWNPDLFTFTKTLDTWNESCTIRYNGNSIAEFQIHNHRNGTKFRFKMGALIELIQSTSNIEDSRGESV